LGSIAISWDGGSTVVCHATGSRVRVTFERWRIAGGGAVCTGIVRIATRNARASGTIMVATAEDGGDATLRVPYPLTTVPAAFAALALVVPGASAQSSGELRTLVILAK
jgi:hypothetical protein